MINITWDILIFVIILIIAILINIFYSSVAAIFLAFLPSIFTIIYNNSENLQLWVAKRKYKYRSVGLSLKTRKNVKIEIINFELNDYQIKEKFKKVLIKNEISVGEENKKIRIERGQIIVEDNNEIDIRIPFTIDIKRSLTIDEVIFYIENNVNPISYCDISVWLNEVQFIWRLLENQIKKIVDAKSVLSYYECHIEVNKNLFKNVYLANYVEDNEVKNLSLNRERHNITFKNNKLKISSKSEKEFIKAINTYAQFSKSFFNYKK